MTMIDRLLAAMTGSAARRYGVEPVTELEHALQCAELASVAGADEELVLACLLHDVGRYALAQTLLSDSIHSAGAGPGAGVPLTADDRLGPATGERGAAGGATGDPVRRGHHELGAELVAPWVPARVAWCIEAHADAKRYLCAVEPEYHDRLSPASRRTLLMQGGVMSPDEARRFAARRWAEEAVALRRWDDQAKVPGRATRSLDAWEPLLRSYFRERLPGSSAGT
jgi:gamma-butyrobetaine dioxygenase